MGHALLRCSESPCKVRNHSYSFRNFTLLRPDPRECKMNIDDFSLKQLL
jgi:hypothetical protein